MNRSYQNPVLPGFHPDPSVCRVGEDYYLVNSSFSWFPGVPIFHSRDLVNWRKMGHVFDRSEQLPLRDPNNVLMDGILAPTIRYHEGKFYCVTTNAGHHGSVLVSADDPAGPWSDPIVFDHPGLDNSLFFDDDGQVYYHWCWPGHPDGQIVQVLIDPATGKFLSEPTSISPGIGAGGAEGPHLYKIDGWYYLLVAEGGTHMGHLLSLQRSRSPWGPFEPSPHGPFLTHRHTEMTQVIKALGHGELIEDHNGNWWVFALGIRTTGWICFASHVLGRETFLAPVTWGDDGWPVVNGGKDLELEMAGPLPDPHPWPEQPVREDFDRPDLGYDWAFRRNPVPGSWSLTEQTGSLTLHGGAAALSNPVRNVVVGRRQQHLFVEVAAEFGFSPRSTNEEAGLSAFMDEHYFSAVGLRGTPSGGREAFLRRRVGACLEVDVATAPLQPGPVILRIHAERRWYRFGFEQDGKTTWLGWAETHHHSTEIAWGWTGVFFCLYASGNGQSASVPAHVNWFDYHPAADQSFTPDMPDRFALVPPSDQ